jgi:branched-chain amino acid transport system substrate-binding protein
MNRRFFTNFRGSFAAFFLGVMLLANGMAQSRDILIGASLPLTGPNAAAGQEGLTAMKAAFGALNAKGGIQGRKVRLEVLDDAFSAATAAENVKLLNAKGGVALFNCWGTSSCSAMMPVITEAKLPMVSGIAGGGPMRAQPGRYVFNVRASTADEIQKMVDVMLTGGQNRIALVYQDDPFGKSGQVAAQGVLQKAGLKAKIELPLARDGSNALAVTRQILQSGANGVILVASPVPTVALIKLARKEGLAIQFYNLAAQANIKVANDLGPNAGSVVFTTVVPSPWKSRMSIVSEYQQAMQAFTGKQDYSYLSLEVFINAKVLIEGLSRAAPNITRDGLIAALETMGEQRFGDAMNIKYSPSERSGSEYIGLTIFNSQGRFME